MEKVMEFEELKRVRTLTCHAKAALSGQLIKDPKCWSGQGLNPRPPAQ